MRVRLRTACVLAWLLAAACSDSTDARGDGAEAGRAASAGTSASQVEGGAGSGGSAPRGNDAGRSGTGGTEEPARAGQGGASGSGGRAPSDAAITPDPDASITDAGDDAGKPPTESPTAVYSTERYIGGLDHLRITKSDPALGYCVTFHMVFPGGPPPPPELELPEGWAGMGATAFEIAGDTCEAGSAQMPVFAMSLTERGWVVWRDLGPQGLPCSVDVDLEFTFEPTQRIPARERMFAEDLAVDCN
jgi:hypothetical protein